MKNHHLDNVYSRSTSSEITSSQQRKGNSQESKESNETPVLAQRRKAKNSTKLAKSSRSDQSGRNHAQQEKCNYRPSDQVNSNGARKLSHIGVRSRDTTSRNQNSGIRHPEGAVR